MAFSLDQKELELIVIVKKRIPWGLLYSVLLIMLAGAYFISGLFTFSDVNILNYGEKIEYILLHPFHIWWNDKTPVTMGIACILWLMGVSYFLTYYRNYHFDAEHGTADWGDVRIMLKQLQDKDPMRNTIVSKNIQIRVLIPNLSPPDLSEKGNRTVTIACQRVKYHQLQDWY